MKLFAALICLVSLQLDTALFAQNIFTYGNGYVTKQEFVKAYNKNNTDSRRTEQAYREYLDLYIRFKLKVQEAYSLKMDTLPNQVAELADFRRQIEQGFMTDDNSVKDLVADAFERSQKDIHLAHIFIAFDVAGTNAAPAKDTMAAWKLATKVCNDLEKGVDFSKLAVLYSSDPSAKKNQGDMGYITVFTLPYALENLAYGTPLGKFSRAYRSNAGYHIFKKLGERKAVGKYKTAQIVFAFPADTTNESRMATRRRADSVYNALLNGASFNEMVNRYSSDETAKSSNGEMPAFGPGSFEPDFENAVFALSKDGAFTKPLMTPVGYHIVKRISQLPVNTDPLDDSAMAVLKQQVQNDARIETARKAMSQKVYRVTGFKKGPFPDSIMLRYAENIHLNKKHKVPATINSKTVMFSFPEQKIYMDDFIKNLQAIRFSESGTTTMQKVLATFEEVKRRDYYRKHLEKYDADFASQLKEFKEGNLLFEIMQKKVWDKASVDSAGQRAFYEKNKFKYWWEPSADAIILSTADTATATSLRSKLNNKISNWKEIVVSFEGKLQSDSGRYELTQLPLGGQPMPKPGQFSNPITNTGDANISYVYLVKQYPQKQQRSFEDAKGFVLNDYQLFLEDKWIEALRKKYPVTVNEAVFASLPK